MFWVWLSRFWREWRESLVIVKHETVVGWHRECLDHVVVLSEKHLRHILKSYFKYYHRSRTHLSLAKDAPEPRAALPPELGAVIEIAEIGGLHPRYERRAAW